MEALQRLHNRGSISTGYNIDNSLKLESDSGERIYKDQGSAVTVTQATVSYWVKRTELGTGAGWTWLDTQNHSAQFNASLSEAFYIAGANESNYKLVTNRMFRDTSAWYHIFVAYDTTQATASDRIKLYVNGVQETSFSTANYPSQNLDLRFLSTNCRWAWGSGANNTSAQPCYLAECYMFHTQALAPTDLGEFDEDTGIWKPIEFTGSFGSNDWYLDFESAGSLGADASGNGNNHTLDNISSADQATDTPTNNFAIYNQLIPKDEFIIYQGGTRSKKTTTNRWRTMVSTLAVANGKWYAEFQNSLYSTTGVLRFVGVAPASIFTETSATTGGYLGGNSTETTDSKGYYSNDGRIYTNGSSVAYGDSWTTNEIIGVALDMDNGYVYFSKNGTWQNSGDPTSGSSGTGGIALQKAGELHYIGGSIYNSNAQLEVNYGGFTVISIASGNTDANGYGNFEYAPPSGYYALCTKNLAQYGG